MIKTKHMPNNLTLVYEQLPHLSSVAFGVFIGTGSRFESLPVNGISHFIEHMVFKGTPHRSARIIAQEMDALGGQIDAFTSKESTCFFTKTLKSDMEKAMEILADILFHSEFQAQHIETEKKVVLEEIDMYEDYPEELVNDLLTEKIWENHPIAMPILGTPETVDAFSADAMRNYMDTHYVPENAVISIVGSFDEEEMLAIVDRLFGHWSSTFAQKQTLIKPEYQSAFINKKKDIEQVHLCLGYRGLSMDDDEIHALMLLSNLFGGGMSSRLFQNIREDAGLAYSVYSYPTTYRDTGLFSLYAATGKENVSDVLDRMHQEISLLLATPVSEEELLRNKKQLRGGFLLSLDSTTSRMNSIGKAQLNMGRIKSHDEILAAIDKVTVQDVTNIAKKVFCSSQAAMAIIGESDLTEKAMERFIFTA